MIALRGITWDHPRGYQPLAASADPYAAEFGVRVTWDRRSLKDFGDAPIDLLAADYDLLIIDHPHMGLAAEAGMPAAAGPDARFRGIGAVGGGKRRS